jgi:glucose-6-phosphate isomerase
VQRPLWASTGVKDPALPDTLYVTELVAPGTVNTMPEKTLEATFDHGVVTGDTVTGAYDDAHLVFAQLAELGVDIADVTQLLEDEGVAKFIASWQDLKKTVAEALATAPETAGEFRDPRLGSRQARRRPDVPGLVDSLVASGITAGDPDLWGPRRHPRRRVRLGWVNAVSVSRPLVPRSSRCARSRRAGLTRVVLAGMGGSSLAPEVIAATAGTAGDPRLDRPGQVLAAIDGDAESGGLAETVSSSPRSRVDGRDRLRATRLRGLRRDLGIDPAERIVVVTDPGSPLDTAREAGYRVFTADPNVGGRYSALTAFGLVPSGLAGVDIAELLDEAEATLLRSPSTTRNPALVLAAAIAGGDPRRDKLGLITDGTHIVGLPDWIEQLVAESTGKNGTGILPVVLLPLSPEVDQTPADLQLVRLVDDAVHFRLIEQHPDEILVSGSLGAQFVVWEYATAIAGRLLGINPFDQPDVESAKEAARGCSTRAPRPEPAFTGTASRCACPIPLWPPPAPRGVLDALWARSATATSRSRPTSIARRAAARGTPRARRRRQRATHHVRLGSALPALDRPVPQGRTGRGRVPADHRSGRGRSRNPRSPVHVRSADHRAGRRRRGCARRARTTRRHAHPHRPAGRGWRCSKPRSSATRSLSDDCRDLARPQSVARPR